MSLCPCSLYYFLFYNHCALNGTKQSPTEVVSTVSVSFFIWFLPDEGLDFCMYKEIINVYLQKTVMYDSSAYLLRSLKSWTPVFTSFL